MAARGAYRLVVAISLVRLSDGGMLAVPYDSNPGKSELPCVAQPARPLLPPLLAQPCPHTQTPLLVGPWHVAVTFSRVEALEGDAHVRPFA